MLLKGPQSTSSIAARSIPADSTADYSPAAGTRVPPARRCDPDTVQHCGGDTPSGAWASSSSRPGYHCALPETTSSTVSNNDYLLRSYCPDIQSNYRWCSRHPCPGGPSRSLKHCGPPLRQRCSRRPVVGARSCRRRLAPLRVRRSRWASRLHPDESHSGCANLLENRVSSC